MSVWISDEKLLIFASLISPSKMILFEKKYQTFDTVFHHQMKHLEVRQKYSATRRIFNSLLCVSSSDETLRLMFDILHKRLQNWWRHHHYLNVEVSWNTTFQFCFFSCSENDAVKKIVLIIVYGKAFYHPYFYHRYKSLIYLVRLKLWYGYGYWLHIILLFSWMLFFDTCPCLDCCLVLDLASTLNITLTFSVAGLILGILYFSGLLLQLFFETCLHSRSFNWLWN